MTNDTTRRYRRFLLSPDTLRIIGRVARERRESPSRALGTIVTEWAGRKSTGSRPVEPGTATP